MLVYRIMNEEEFELLTAGKKECLGGCFYGLTLPNNHRYKKGVKYLHFFKNQTAINRYLRSISFTEEGQYFVGTFNIPFRKLFTHCSYGRYMPSGYDVDYEVEKEYALPVNKFETEYLVDIKKLQDIEEFER